jgi:hypothetical protein
MKEWPDFQFKLETRDAVNPFSLFGITWLDRWCARAICMMIWRSGKKSFQFGGYDGALKKNYYMVMADRFQLMHWILRVAGYDCCAADIAERCGLSGSDKAGPDDCLWVINEKGE